MTPFPSTSYILKAHFSFSSGVPLEVTSIASKNSCRKSVLKINIGIKLINLYPKNIKKKTN